MPTLRSSAKAEFRSVAPDFPRSLPTCPQLLELSTVAERIHWLPEAVVLECLQLTVGSKSSAGCIRLVHDDIAELFDLVPMYTKVTIRP